MSRNSGFVDTKASHVPSRGSLVKATELWDRPGGFSSGAFGVTVFGGAGFARGCWEPCQEWKRGGFFCGRLSRYVSYPVSERRGIWAAPFCSFGSLGRGWSCRGGCCTRSLMTNLVLLYFTAPDFTALIR